jgi:hypothetical protein
VVVWVYAQVVQTSRKDGWGTAQLRRRTIVESTKRAMLGCAVKQSMHCQGILECHNEAGFSHQMLLQCMYERYMRLVVQGVKSTGISYRGNL